MAKRVKIPPPNKRLCVRHGESISPSKWRGGCRTTQCKSCLNERRRIKEARAIVPPPEQRLCKRHGKPVCPSNWIQGRKNQCSKCNTERLAKQTKLPPPEQRLCKIHAKPICPSVWIHGCRTSGCSKCINQRTRRSAQRRKRAKKRDSTFVCPRPACGKTAHCDLATCNLEL